MYASVRWLNDYLDPPATAEEQAELLTRAGFPLEGTQPVPEVDDVRQDFEMTSNRGDCVCHVGLAREIAAMSDRTLKIPATVPTAGGAPAASLISVTNHEHAACPLYTARVIRGITVGCRATTLAKTIWCFSVRPSHTLRASRGPNNGIALERNRLFSNDGNVWLGQSLI